MRWPQEWRLDRFFDIARTYNLRIGYASGMNIYPSHTLALGLWRAWSLAHPVSLSAFHASSKRNGLPLPVHALPSSSVVKAAASKWADVVAALSALPSALLAETIEDAQNERRPLEILVGTKRGARSTNCIQRHQCQLRFPRNAFLEMVPEVWVSAPELVFVQMASQLEYGALLALGYELCGCYPLGEGSGFQVRGPLTTPERLVAFSGQLGGARSAKLARSAALQVRRKSASIMETEVAIAALTSRRRGGLGLPPARLNEPFALGEKAQRIAHQKSVVGDICWWDKGAVVEYDGRESHGSREAQIRDSRRRDALLAEGIDVTTITSSQFANVCEFSTLMGEVSQKAGKVFRGWRPGQIEKHMKLRQDVRSFHRDYPSRR